ncbi:MAG: DUF1351 domain-containing protein [Oscillospiraceae bacterium]|nr:DUF1351 domain-containing protein [Oscillospiraceae bacterium]
MEELQVLVQQTPGEIRWNYEDLKVALQERLKIYEGMIYDDDSIKAAKADAAMLRKLRKAVEDKRKEIKNKCLEPYEIIEAQSKELTGIIDRPIALITKQVNEYEEQRRAAVKKRITAYMTEVFAGLPEAIQKKAQFSVYDTRWENATAKESDWKAAIDQAHEQIATALNVIQNTDEDFRDEAMKVYCQNLSLPDAMAKVQELQRQKEMLIERQRQREEEQRRREAEAAAAKAAQEAQAAQNIERQEAQPTPPENYARETQNIELDTAPVSPMGRAIDSIDRQAFERAAAADYPSASATIRLFGANDAQVKKVVDYIHFMGIKCEVSR